MADSLSVRFIAEVARLFRSYVTDPLDTQWNHGNAAVVVIEPDGSFHGKIFGDDKEICQKCYQVGMRKVLQVWRTGHYTGKFEELVYSGKINENDFGVQRPDLIGWEGGCPSSPPTESWWPRRSPVSGESRTSRFSSAQPRPWGS